MDSLWRKKLVAWSTVPQNGKVLDCATGTGALALEFSRLESTAQVTGVDFCEEMLKQVPNHDSTRVKFLKADINALPFADQSFDVCAIAYGLRNTESLEKTLLEMGRVLKPGGKLMILETGNHPFFLLYPFFYIYFRWIMPCIGGLITGQKSAYKYLQKSSKNFPSRKELIEIIKNTGCFKHCEYKSLFFGASFIYKCWRI